MNMKEIVKKIKQFKKVGVQDVKLGYNKDGILKLYPHKCLIPNEYRVALLDIGGHMTVDNTDELERLRSAFIKLEDVGRIDFYSYGLMAYYKNGRKAITVVVEDYLKNLY